MAALNGSDRLASCDSGGGYMHAEPASEMDP